MDFDEVLAVARGLWGDGVEATDDTVHAAAVGLAANWYRNTNAVETIAHAQGPWSDEDMLRRNAWATKLCLDALLALRAAAPDKVEAVLTTLLSELVQMLPTTRARRSLQEEKGQAAGAASRWIATKWVRQPAPVPVTGLQLPTRLVGRARLRGTRGRVVRLRTRGHRSKRASGSAC